MSALTFKEWVEDKKKQLSNCPCNDCKYRIDHDSPNHVGLNNDWEPLYPREYPLSFACARKIGWLDTKVMKHKRCQHKIYKKDYMEIDDLMIGDWVQLPKELDKYMQVLSISDIDKATLCLPIPITAEILEKNGFAFHDNDGGYYGNFEESYFNQTVEVVLFNVKNENRNCQLHISDENITYLHLMACNYVHQLQHALKVCGIKKEIML